MTRFWNLVLTSCVVLSASEPPVHGADEPPKATSPATVTNVAVIYWQAFSRMPKLTNEQSKAIAEAIASVSAPISDEVAEVISNSEGALQELQRAQVDAPCDWHLDVDQGPGMLLLHADKSRFISRVALLRARQRFSAGETDAAVSDVLSVYKMGRDCSAHPGVILTLVNGQIEQLASEVLAANLPLLNKEQLDKLTTSLRERPKASSLASAFREEGRSYTLWLTRMVDFEDARLNDPKAGYELIEAINRSAGIDLDRDVISDLDGESSIVARESLESLSVADVRESIELLKADCMELEKIAEMPHDERTARVSQYFDTLSEAGKFKNNNDARRYFSVALLSLGQRGLIAQEQMDVRRQLFEQAIHIQRDGVDVKPINGRKVEYKKTDTGFELKCPSNGDTIVIKVGR